MTRTPEPAPIPLDELVRLFGGEKGEEVVRRHGGTGSCPARFEILKSGGAAALIADRNRSPIAFCACPAGPAGALEIVRLDPEHDRGLRGRKLMRKPKRLEELCAPLFKVECQRLVAYHPERRAVLRLDGRDGSGAPTIFYAKLLRRSAFARARQLYDALSRHAERAGLVQPVLASEDHHVFVYGSAPGRSLHEQLLAGDEPALDALVEGVERLREIEPPAGLAEHTFEDEKRATLKMIDRGIVVVPELERLRRAVAEIDLPECSAWGFVHRDLHDKQIFMHEGRVRFIDFEGAARGPRDLDVVNLVEHCFLRTLQERALRGKDLGRKLLERFAVEPTDSDPRDREIKTLTALTRARIAGVYAARPRWRSLSLERATSAFERLGEIK